MDNMVRIEPAFEIGLFIPEFALIKVIEKPVIWHDMIRVEGATHRPVCTLTHE